VRAASSHTAPAPPSVRAAPPLIAHRGNALEYPENTLPAFESALNLGLHHVELDVQLSRDRVPFVLHDATLVRTCGIAGAIWDRAATELRQIEAAETTRFGATHAGVRLPDLDSALALLQGWPDAGLFVEIKTESIGHFGLQTVLRAVLDLLAGRPGRWTVISFDYEAVAQARALSALPIGWVLTRYDAASAARARALAPDYLFCNWQKLPTREALWPGPWRWCSYEVREVGRARSLLARGVDLIETMAVRKLRDALGGGAPAPT
jgi:glycerophosphoryl diester phosphodiesterase